MPHIPKHLFCVAVVRGRKTSYYYGEKLKDALACGVKVGEEFSYVKYDASEARDGEMTSSTTYALASYAGGD